MLLRRITMKSNLRVNQALASLVAGSSVATACPTDTALSMNASASSSSKKSSKKSTFSIDAILCSSNSNSNSSHNYLKNVSNCKQRHRSSSCSMSAVECNTKAGMNTLTDGHDSDEMSVEMEEEVDDVTNASDNKHIAVSKSGVLQEKSSQPSFPMHQASEFAYAPANGHSVRAHHQQQQPFLLNTLRQTMEALAATANISNNDNDNRFAASGNSGAGRAQNFWLDSYFSNYLLKAEYLATRPRLTNMLFSSSSPLSSSSSSPQFYSNDTLNATTMRQTTRPTSSSSSTSSSSCQLTNGNNPNELTFDIKSLLEHSPFSCLSSNFPGLNANTSSATQGNCTTPSGFQLNLSSNVFANNNNSNNCNENGNNISYYSLNQTVSRKLQFKLLLLLWRFCLCFCLFAC